MKHFMLLWLSFSAPETRVARLLANRMLAYAGCDSRMTFETFYQDNYWKAYAYFTRKGVGHHDAEELTQEVFLYCYKHFSAYDPERSAITTWLYTITASRFKNYCRDRKLALPFDDMVDLGDGGDSVELAAELDEKRRLLARILETLPEQQRKAVILRYFQGLSTAEIAQSLGVSDGNARVILSRALAATRNLSERDDG